MDDTQEFKAFKGYIHTNINHIIIAQKKKTIANNPYAVP